VINRYDDEDVTNPAVLYPERDDFNDSMRLQHRAYARRRALDDPELIAVIRRITDTPEAAEDLMRVIAQQRQQVRPEDVQDVLQTMQGGEDVPRCWPCATASVRPGENPAIPPLWCIREPPIRI
jgi:hypothetical protein